MNTCGLFTRTLSQRRSHEIIRAFQLEAAVRAIGSKTGTDNRERVPLWFCDSQKHRLISRIYFEHPIARIDISTCTANNCTMARPEVAHRIKSYSAATGFVYQYQFVEVQKARRGLSLGNEYVYIVSVDRKENFPLTVFVKQSAEDKWAKREGRKLSGTEEYAAAKMRLFQAFDELEDLAAAKPDLLVDDSNLDALLKALDL
jgi:hypothetical protein